MVGWPVGPSESAQLLTPGREGQEALSPWAPADGKPAHRLLVARVGVMWAIVPGNGPQHQPCYLRVPSGCHTLSLAALPHGLASRPCRGHPSFCSSHCRPSLAHMRGVSWLVPSARHRPWAGRAVTRQDMDASGPPTLAGLGPGPSVGASPHPHLIALTSGTQQVL